MSNSKTNGSRLNVQVIKLKVQKKLCCCDRDKVCKSKNLFSSSRSQVIKNITTSVNDRQRLLSTSLGKKCSKKFLRIQSFQFDPNFQEVERKSLESRTKQK